MKTGCYFSVPHPAWSWIQLLKRAESGVEAVRVSFRWAAAKVQESSGGGSRSRLNAPATANAGKAGAEGPSPGSEREVEFRLKAPAAGFVKLAGDFTEWEQHPIQMVRLAGGTWFTSVPLPPGSYSYRFIIDGRWTDDPGAEVRERNPFGTQNSVVQVM